MKLQIIVGSTRPGRVSDKVARWVASEAKDLADTDVEILDLSDYQLPLFNEEQSPQYNPNRTSDAPVQKWLDKLAEADAFVLVMPEYNRSISGVLKNALDFIDFQFAKKPVAIVAHGVTGGAQAVSHMRGIIPSLLAVSVPSATYMIGAVGQLLDDSGELTDEEARSNPYGVQGALKTTLAQVKWYSDALSEARAKDS